MAEEANSGLGLSILELMSNNPHLFDNYFVYFTNRLRLGILLPKRCRNLSNSAIVSFENS